MIKRPLTQYEKMIIANACNIKNYCAKIENCNECIFRVDTYTCELTLVGVDPYSWNIAKVLKAGEKND